MGAARKIVVQYPLWEVELGEGQNRKPIGLNPTDCPCCQGLGGFTMRARDGPNPFPCEICSGHGKLKFDDEWMLYLKLERYLYQRLCPCEGGGSKDCYCGGQGIVLVDQTGKPYYLGFPDSHRTLRNCYESWEDIIPGIIRRGRHALPSWHGLYED